MLILRSWTLLTAVVTIAVATPVAVEERATGIYRKFFHLTSMFLYRHNPTKGAIVTAFATVVTSIFTTTTATTTSSSISVTEVVVAETTFVPATFQQVSNQVGCDFTGIQSGSDVGTGTSVLADAEAQCLEDCFGVNTTV
jgi:hypothetical protein